MKTNLLRALRIGAAAVSIASIGCSGAAQAQTSPSAFKTIYRYDTAGRVVGVIRPDPDGSGPIKYATTRNTYDAVTGVLSKVEVGELGSWSSDSDWSTFSIFQSREFTYDSFGRKLTEKLKDASGTAYSLTQYSYDYLSRVVCTTLRMNIAAYGSLPADACTLGAEGSQGPDRITRNTYDNTTHLLQIDKAVGTSLLQTYAKYSYTANGKQESATDANGNKSFYLYDGFDRQSYWYFPSKTTAGQYSSTDYEYYTYDANGNRRSLRKRDGNLINSDFDALNRLVLKSYPSGINQAVYYDYDLRNLQLEARLGSATGPGISTTYTGFGQVLTSKTTMAGVPWLMSYLYDLDGNRIRVTHPEGAYFTYAYDGLNRPVQIRENGSALLVEATYDNQGRRGFLTRGGSLGAGVAMTSYGFDPVSRLQTLIQDLDGAGTANDQTLTFAYSPANQITNRTLSNSAYAFTQFPTSNVNYLVNGLNEYTSVSSMPGSGPAYDANGNMTSDGSSTYGYDLENRLISASGGRSLGYDPNGRLYQTSGGSTGTTRFLYDGDALVAEYDASNNLVRRYVHGSGLDEPLVQYIGPSVAAGNRSYFYANHQGSVVAVTNSSGITTEVNTYDPYGIPGVPLSAGRSRFQYTGQIALPDLGMYYYKARIYYPGIGRFMQTDPIGYKDDLDLYTYVGDDPLNKVDPTGLAGCEANLEGGKTCTYEIKTSIAGAAVVAAGSAAWNAGVKVANSISSNENQKAEATSTTIASSRADSYVVRVQAQGTSLKEEVSVPINSNAPIKANLVLGALAEMKSELTPKEQTKFAPAFTAASAWVDKVGKAGGIGPIGSTSFNIPGIKGSEARVDVEILKGHNLVP